MTIAQIENAQIENAQIENNEIRLRHLWLEITKKCNLRCEHCYVGAGSHLPLLEDMTIRQWVKVINEGYEEGCRSIQFIGGEPILHPDLDILLRTARTLGYEAIEVYTNGTCHPSKWLDLFVELRVNVAFSFYATKPEIHDEITGVQGSYQLTLKGIDLALAAGLRVRVGIIQISQTDEEIELTLELLKLRGVTNVGFDRMRHIGRADNDGAYTPPLKQLGELCGQCSNGKLVVTTTGQTYPCIMARAWPLGSIENGLKSVIHSQQLAIFRKNQLDLMVAKGNMVIKNCPSDPPKCKPSNPPPPGCKPYCKPSDDW